MIDPNLGVMWQWLAAVTIPAAALSGWRLWIIERRERVQRTRLDGFRGEIRVTQSTPAPSSWTHHIANSLSSILGVVEQQRLLKMLKAAGIRSQGSLATFIAMKGFSALVLIILTWSLHVFASGMFFRLAVLGAAFLVGWRMPDLVLAHLVKRRRLRLENGIPDALDLLVICAEAGLSLNQAIEEVSHQLYASNKDVAEEFATTSAEIRVMPDFGRALDNLVGRTQLRQLRSLISTLKQSVRYGTPLAESLRMIATEMRAEHHARLEEKAARLPVLLAVPMMAFILPCLLMIIGTPVVIRIIDTVKTITIGGHGIL